MMKIYITCLPQILSFSSRFRRFEMKNFLLSYCYVVFVIIVFFMKSNYDSKSLLLQCVLVGGIVFVTTVVENFAQQSQNSGPLQVQILLLGFGDLQWWESLITYFRIESCFRFALKDPLHNNSVLLGDSKRMGSMDASFIQYPSRHTTSFQRL